MLLCSQGEVQKVISEQTSGTTGAGKRVFYTEGDCEHTIELFMAGLGEFIYPGSITMVAMPFSGPFGLGETETRNSIRESLGLYRDDSAGLIQITYTFGWFMGIYYISSLCGIARRLFMTDAHKEKVGIGILMIILHSTEGLWSLPLFWILMLEYSEKETA